LSNWIQPATAVVHSASLSVYWPGTLARIQRAPRNHRRRQRRWHQRVHAVHGMAGCRPSCGPEHPSRRRISMDQRSRRQPGYRQSL